MPRPTVFESRGRSVQASQAILNQYAHLGGKRVRYDLRLCREDRHGDQRECVNVVVLHYWDSSDKLDGDRQWHVAWERDRHGFGN